MTGWKGEKIGIQLFGASHDDFIGVTVSGIKKGLRVDRGEIDGLLALRRPSGESYSTTRKEPDLYEFTGGIENDYTCGGDITAVIRNTAQRSADYEKIKGIMRPGHADYAASAKYGADTDLRGGGIFSGRLTAPICVAGGLAAGILKKKGIKIVAYLSEAAGVEFGSYGDGLKPPAAETGAFEAADERKKALVSELFDKAKKNGDSVGGIVECVAIGVPPGRGDAQFGSLESRISALAFGIPAVKAVEFGLGRDFAKASGSSVRDAWYYDNSVVRSETNYNGGINGGISNGMPVCFRVTVKPAPSIALPCRTVDIINGTETLLSISGRHDVCIAPRAVPVVKSIAAIALLDATEE